MLGLERSETDARRLRAIANAKIETRLRAICEKEGWRLPALCTPEELMGEEDEGDDEYA